MEPVTFEEFAVRMEKVLTYLGVFRTTHAVAKAQCEVLIACTETMRKYFADNMDLDAMSFDFPELLTNSLEYKSAHTIEAWVAACLLASRDHQIDVYTISQSAATRAFENIKNLIDKAKGEFGGDFAAVDVGGYIKYKTREGSENAVHIYASDENTLRTTGGKKSMNTVVIESSHLPRGIVDSIVNATKANDRTNLIVSTGSSDWSHAEIRFWFQAGTATPANE